MSTWTLYVCPACGMGPFSREGDAQLHAAVRCEPDTWPWEPVKAVPLDAVISALEAGYHPQNPSDAHPADFIERAFSDASREERAK